MPHGLWRRPDETQEDHNARKTTKGGVELIARDTTRVVDITSIRGKIEAISYKLVAASTQERMRYNWDSDYNASTYYTVKYIFAESTADSLSKNFNQAVASPGLDLNAAMAFWHMRAYSNSCDNQAVLSINFEGREQRFIGEDPRNPFKLRRRDAQGEQYGKPEVFRANSTLIFKDGVPVLVPYQI